MALPTIGGGETPGLVTAAYPCSTYRAVGPNVGDFVRIYNSGNKSFCVNSLAGGGSIGAAPYAWGIVRDVNNDSTVVTVEWQNVRSIRVFQLSGTVSVARGLIAVNTARNNKVSGINTLASTSPPYPQVAATADPASGYCTAFIL